ncbi:hypothetical protein [Methanorbis rubei]|uniref:Uncharacterized protein n=1 Tax=Methanorbis rubei TaxID=3028300 RepID=A0AAE4MGS6_9EURY|nr:hypothetical protein [Methanocorpusculaceae archaeon Cs1]
MKSISSMLELDSLRFLEPDYASLVNNGEPGILICEAEPTSGGARMLIDDEENPVLFAVRAGDEWVGTSWSFRSPTEQEFALFSATDGDIYQEPRSVIDDALRAHFSNILVEEVAPAREDLPADRIEKVRDLLHEVWGASAPGLCLDACAGSGIGSMIIREMGGVPLAYDNDPALLALGLSSGRLTPEGTVCIDGTVASAYLPDADRGLGIMFGQMYVYTQDLWRPIVEELAGITAETLITVATEEEAQWVRSWAREVDRDLEIWENERDPIYDRWVCFG